MSLPDYDSPSALKAILDSRAMAMQKKFGQNFLINSNARTKLAENLDLQENMKVWEVGPGLGALTTEILKRKANYTVNNSCSFSFNSASIFLLYSFTKS